MATLEWQSRQGEGPYSLANMAAIKWQSRQGEIAREGQAMTAVSDFDFFTRSKAGIHADVNFTA
jgi:hypothetical protein